MSTERPSKFSREWWEQQDKEFSQQVGQALVELEAQKEKLAKLQGAHGFCRVVLSKWDSENK